ncbi:MAG: YdbL family protein [Sulfuricella denitrificans]|nr:YdbL family protein [Sulfuricella denitrificans]
MKVLTHIFSWLILFALWGSSLALAAADLEINTPAITSLKQGMQQRHAELAGFYTSGAVGLTRDGMVAVHDPAAAPLAQRQMMNSLVAAENQDRMALYREIARANGHPEWEDEVRSTFAQRWISKAASGWWHQNPSGAWVKK